MSNTTTFVLIKGNPTSWNVKQKGLMIEKPNEGLKFAAYYPGHDSIYVEDIKNKDIVASLIPSFEFNPSSNRTELTVPNSDVNLIKLLKLHPHYGKKFEIFSEELESTKALSKYNQIEKALEYIKSDNDLEIRAKGVVVLGVDAIHYLPSVSLAKLKEKAFSNPEVVISKINGIDYEAQFISAQAYIQGVVKNNLGHTAIVWGDSENMISPLGTGEIGNEKLGRILAQNNEQSASMLQVIAQKLGVDSNTTIADTSKDDFLIKEKDAEIKRLQEQISQKETDTSKDDLIAQLQAQLAEVSKGGNEETSGDLTLEDAQAKYLEKFGKEVGPRFKNDIDWIKAELDK
jgi:hypothetical protein